MSTDQGGIQDGITVELTSAPPLHAPAMALVELLVVYTMPTATWLANHYTVEQVRDAVAAHMLFGSSTTTVGYSNVERRFLAEEILDAQGASGGWMVTDDHKDDLIATFDIAEHARRYADALERNPALVDA